MAFVFCQQNAMTLSPLSNGDNVLKEVLITKTTGVIQNASAIRPVVTGWVRVPFVSSLIHAAIDLGTY